MANIIINTPQPSMYDFMKDAHDGRSWETTRLGQWAAHPGHPIVVACAIMDRYPNFEAAIEPAPVMSVRGTVEGERTPTALRDGFLHGTGCAVYAGLDCLKLARNQGLAAAYRHARGYWDSYASGATSESHRNAVALGIRQFELVKSLFESHLATWGTATDAGSPFRRAA